MKRGFSAIETLAALTITSVVVLTVFLGITATTRLQIRARHTTIATALAERAIEKQRTKKFSDLANGTTTAALSGLPSARESVTISDVADDLKKISVTVSWTSNGSRTVTLETLATDGGLNDVSE